MAVRCREYKVQQAAAVRVVFREVLQALPANVVHLWVTAYTNRAEMQWGLGDVFGACIAIVPAC